MRFRTNSGDIERTMRFVAAAPRAKAIKTGSIFNSLVWGDAPQKYGEIAGTRKWTQLTVSPSLGFGTAPHGTPQQLAAAEPCEIVPRIAAGDFLRLPDCAASAAAFRGFPLDPSDRANNGVLLSLIWSLYNETTPETTARVQAIFGPSATVQVLARVSPLAPKAVLIHTPLGYVFLSEGTTNESQLIGQVISSLQGPRFRNGVDGAELPLVIAQDYYGQLRSLINPATHEPIIFAGHSYGGAIAQLVAAMYVKNEAPNPVSVVTFGAPRHIGLESARLLQSVPRTNVAEKGDLVTHLPPHSATLTWLIPLKGEVIAQRFNMFVNVEPVYVIGAGPIYPDPTFFDPNNDELETLFVDTVISGMLPEPVSNHSTQKYVNDYAIEAGSILFPDWMEAPQRTAYSDLIAAIGP